MNKQNTVKHGGDLSFRKPLPLLVLKGQRGSSGQEEASWAEVWPTRREEATCQTAGLQVGSEEKAF